MFFTVSNIPELHSDPAVNKWLNSVGENTRYAYKWHFETFMKWVKINGGKFSTVKPVDLVEYMLDATQRETNDFLDLKKAYLQTMKGTSGHKLNTNKAVHSFFMHNRVDLPKDATLNVKSDRPPVDGNLTPDDVKKLVMASNRTYRSVILCMLGGGIGQEEFMYWSNNGLTEVKEQLQSDLVKIKMIGRKKSKNEHPYHTYIGGDALEALTIYLNKTRPRIVERVTAKNMKEGRSYRDPGAIYLNQRGESLSKNAFKLYWLRYIKQLGLVDPDKHKETLHARRYGKNPHNLRDVFRTQWRKSGVDTEYAEYFMGHVKAFDDYGYDKTYKNEADLKAKYKQALPYLNIVSDPRALGLVNVDEYENQKISELENKVTSLTADMKLMYEALKKENIEDSK